MALIANTNVTSLNAQRTINAPSNKLAISLQRLSSGLRIYSAKDDVAGLGVLQISATRINNHKVVGKWD
jgi:flagellin